MRRFLCRVFGHRWRYDDWQFFLATKGACYRCGLPWHGADGKEGA